MCMCVCVCVCVNVCVCVCTAEARSILQRYTVLTVWHCFAYGMTYVWNDVSDVHMKGYGRTCPTGMKGCMCGRIYSWKEVSNIRMKDWMYWRTYVAIEGRMHGNTYIWRDVHMEGHTYERMYVLNDIQMYERKDGQAVIIFKFLGEILEIWPFLQLFQNGWA